MYYTYILLFHNRDSEQLSIFYLSDSLMQHNTWYCSLLHMYMNFTVDVREHTSLNMTRELEV